MLIISPDASRTGTPILLLNHLRWFKLNTNQKFILILNYGGELLEEYRSIVEVYLWEDIIMPFSSLKESDSYFLKLIRKVFQKNETTFVNLFVLKLKRKYEVGLIYSNSARNGHILLFLVKRFKCKVLTYVHEGEKIMDFYKQHGNVPYNIKISDEFVAVSRTVEKVLKDKFNVDQPIKVIPGGIDTTLNASKERRVLLRDAGIPDNAIVVMTSAWLGWHKGTDFFMQIARILSTLNSRLHFVWLGGNEEDEAYKQIMFDVVKLNLADRISILTSRPNPFDYISTAEIFLMLSREESFSLVTIEAGLASKPVLCFEDCGGPNEILDFDPRFIVPYADVNKMCERILFLINNPKELNKMGTDLHERVINNYSVEKSANALWELIKNKMD